jgi:hypothetical protein
LNNVPVKKMLVAQRWPAAPLVKDRSAKAPERASDEAPDGWAMAVEVLPPSDAAPEVKIEPAVAVDVVPSHVQGLRS